MGEGAGEGEEVGAAPDRRSRSRRRHGLIAHPEKQCLGGTFKEVLQQILGYCYLGITYIRQEKFFVHLGKFVVLSRVCLKYRKCHEVCSVEYGMFSVQHPVFGIQQGAAGMPL